MNSSFAVVIPLYNHEAYIGAAIESIFAQTLPATEIVVIDDGSRDGGYDVAAKLLEGRPNARLLRQTNIGAHETLNRAIQFATATHIAVLNSDDTFAPGKLERCASLFARHQDIDLIFGAVGLIDDLGLTVSSGPTADWLDRCRALLQRTGDLTLALLQENFAVTTSNFVFGKRFWNRQGRFQALRYCHDLDFLLHALNRGRVLFDHDVVHIGYRVHAANTIKEALEAIHAEIAAVLACNLPDLSPVSSGGGRNPAALEQALRYRGLSDHILSLMPLRVQAPNRATFYQLALAPGHVERQAQGTAIFGQADEHGRPPPMGPIIAGVGRQAPSDLAAKPRDTNSTPGPGVVIEVSSFDKGGLEKVVLDSAISLKRRGFRPLVVSVGKVGFLGEKAIANGIEVVRLPAVAPLLFYDALLRARDIRLSMSHFSRVGYPLFTTLGIPNITFIHNVYAMLTGESLLNFVADARHVDRFISVSQKATDYATGRLGVDLDKVITIPNGIIVSELTDRERNAPTLHRSAFGLAETDYVFLNVASYNLHKAHYLMAEALKMARKERPEIKIICVGNDVYPPHARELRAFIEREDLSMHMLLPGFYGEIASVFRIADAFLLPSFIEGWSIAMMEAMFFGKPMILSDTGGSSDVIEDSDIGLVIPNEYGNILNLDSQMLDDLAYSPQTYETAPILANAMVRFACERERWREAGARGREKVLRNYDFEDTMDRYEAVIRSCLARRDDSRTMRVAAC